MIEARRKALQADQEAALMVEMERRKREEESKRLEIQRICEADPSLRDLQNKLKMAYVSRERFGQIKEKEVIIDSEKAAARAAAEDFEARRLAALEAEKHAQIERREREMASKGELQKQLIEKVCVNCSVDLAAELRSLHSLSHAGSRKEYAFLAHSRNCPVLQEEWNGQAHSQDQYTRLRATGFDALHLLARVTIWFACICRRCVTFCKRRRRLSGSGQWWLTSCPRYMLKTKRRPPPAPRLGMRPFVSSSSSRGSARLPLWSNVPASGRRSTRLLSMQWRR